MGQRRAEVVADLRTYNQLASEEEIPKGAECLVRKLLYVDLVPYDTVKKIIKTSKSISDISVLSAAVSMGKSVSFMKDYLTHGDEELSMSYLDALMSKIPRDMIDQMRECGLSAYAVTQISEAYRSGVKRDGLKLCIQKGMEADQIRILLMELKQKDGFERARVLARPELDVYQMNTVERLFILGLRAQEAETFLDAALNCRELMRRGMEILERRGCVKTNCMKMPGRRR